MNVQSANAATPVSGCAPVLPEVQQLNALNLRSLIEAQDGRFVSIDYIKNDGSSRTLTGRLGVVAHLKGGHTTVMADDRPYITVFDVVARGYRTVNLATVRSMRAGGKVYHVA